ncbi:MAG: metallophosphoesterase [Verrucomicrobiota bacterium]
MPSPSKPLREPLRVISDLHLGHDISTVRTVESLRGLVAGAGTMIFNGDTSQERGTMFRDKADRMLAELHQLCAEEKADTVFLKGNHDPAVDGPDLLDLASGRVTVMHGDILLPLISPWSLHVRKFRPVLEKIHAEYDAEARRRLDVRIEIVRRCRDALPPSFTRQRGHTLKERARLFLREIWPPRRPWEVLKVWTRLAGTASGFMEEFRPEAEVLIFGHTHRPHVWRRRGRLLVNTGAFVTFARPLMVEIAGRTLLVRPMSEAGGHWRMAAPAVSHALRGTAA